MRQRILFVGVHNDARSQMAEAFVNAAFPTRFAAQSSGLAPACLNPLMVEVMCEIGCDISQKKPESIFDFMKRGERFDYVITLFDETTIDQCPVFAGAHTRLHWGFADPLAYQGSHEEQLAFMRHVRDEIHGQITHWCEEQCGCLTVA
jgi:arsenate reductase